MAQVSPANAQVSLSGKELNRALWGTPFPVNPGKVLIEATAPSYQHFRQERDAKEGATLTVEVKLELEACDDKSERVGDRCVPKPKAPVSCKDGFVLQGDTCIEQKRDPPAPPQPGGTAWGPWITMGAGAAVAVVGGIFLIKSNSHVSDVNAQCSSSDGCTQAWFDSEKSSVNSQRAIGIGGLVVGGLAVAGGALWYALTPSAPSKTSAVRVQVNPLARALVVQGSF